MPRSQKPRRLFFDLKAVYFKPRAVPLSMLEEVELGVDGLEAIRLCDFKRLEQEVVVKKMEISQSTLSRILLSARKNC